MSPTSQTPEHALVGTFWCSLFPSPVLNTRTCLHGHVLVLAHLPSPSPSSRTPEQARVWLVLVLVHLRSSFLSSQASEQAHTGSVLTHLSSPYPSSQTPERAHM